MITYASSRITISLRSSPQMSNPLPSADAKEISVIVPIYNVAAYVEEGLKSIASQDFDQSYEVILVDDSSTDGSVDICREFLLQHQLSNFKLIENKENQGVSVTRNRGLDEARGRYFMFLDPDDLLTPNALSVLSAAAKQFNAAIVKGNNTIFNDAGETAAPYNVNQTCTLGKDQILTTFYEHDKLRGHPWGKLFLREQLGSYRFPVGVRMAQDLFYCSEVFSHADSLVLLDQDVYRYRKRASGSTGSKYESGSYLDWLESVEKTARFATTPDHLRAHKNLLVRTMTQLARECVKLPQKPAEEVLSVIENRCNKWNIRLLSLIFQDRLSLRTIGRYLKMRLATRKIRHQLQRSQ